MCFAFSPTTCNCGDSGGGYGGSGGGGCDGCGCGGEVVVGVLVTAFVRVAVVIHLGGLEFR